MAGKRAGLAGSRSGLFYEITRIIKEMRAATNGRCPTFALLENVHGLLSSDSGRDFAAVLRELAESGAMDIAWTVLDTQWFGVPQRRRRVFIVADFRGERAGEILSVPYGSPRDTPPSREAGSGVAALTANGVGTCGADDNQGQAGHLIPQLANGLTCRYGKGTDSDATDTFVPVAIHENQRGELSLNDTIGSLNTGGGKPGQGYPAVAYQCHGTNVGPMGTFRRGNGSITSGVPFIQTREETRGVSMAVRRLTPL